MQVLYLSLRKMKQALKKTREEQSFYFLKFTYVYLLLKLRTDLTSCFLVSLFRHLYLLLLLSFLYIFPPYTSLFLSQTISYSATQTQWLSSQLSSPFSASLVLELWAPPYPERSIFLCRKYGPQTF